MSSEVQKIQILHPRPSSIVAALYTLRDLGADVIILHGPSGCCFKHARLLEEDGVRVLTTSLDEVGFVFGGQEALTKLLKKAKDLFNPKLMAVSGTCSSMIIGDDLHQAVLNANLDVPVLEVEVHAGYRDNTQGVIISLEAARDMGIIDETEFQRQKSLLDKATEVEKLYGAASDEYLPPERGDVKYEVAARLLKLIGAGKRGLNVLNAKKETAYMFADVTAAVSEASGDQVDNLANLNDKLGLPKVQKDARNIADELRSRGISFDLIGGLDEYPIVGKAVGEFIQEHGEYDFVVLSGVPHAIPISYIKDMEIFSITNGPRQVKPLRDMGHQHVVVELDLHPKTMGVSSIVESEFGATLRALQRANAERDRCEEK
ncbi:MAG: Ni-sirohydrochlorin a,c-diamide reductive cyclase catalytic subunit [Methanotrichaceae archaeon]|nr:Ni-sirohydrochlorin a,c-diamide reductive cyclase catalytic subunit [Methanotrichaceae archaeon]